MDLLNLTLFVDIRDPVDRETIIKMIFFEAASININSWEIMDWEKKFTSIINESKANLSKVRVRICKLKWIFPLTWPQTHSADSVSETLGSNPIPGLNRPFTLDLTINEIFHFNWNGSNKLSWTNQFSNLSLYKHSCNSVQEGFLYK
jgi:hypothetical protein